MGQKRDDEDSALFREATRGVKPLAHAGVVPGGRKPPPRARFTRAGQRELLQESLHGSPDEPPLTAADEVSFSRAGIADGTLRKLRRGHFRVQAELDLHGLNLAGAKLVLREFLGEALARDARCIRIIHGKGLRSGPGGPVLKQAVSSILKRTQHVLAFVSARQVDGGTGAVYVLLAPRFHAPDPSST